MSPAPYYQDDHVTLYHGDCLDVLPTLAAASVGCVFTDPPYFRVKGEWWDRQWDTADGFLRWLGDVADEWRRVLASNGSLYCFASPKMAARVEVMLSDRFAILNRVRWVKANGWHKRSDKEALRSFLSPWEEVIFAEQFGQDTTARGDYTAAEAALRTSVFEPLRAWMADERDRCGVSVDQINRALGTATMAAHFFGRSQWQLPTAEHYAKIQAITGGFRREYEDLRREYEDLRREYEDLRREYEDLRREYEDLRRPFLTAPGDEATDLWHFPTVAPYPGKHPCEKPEPLIRHALALSHRHTMPPVLDCFAGSGATLTTAAAMGRQAIGVEMDEAWCERIALRLSEPALDFGAAS